MNKLLLIDGNSLMFRAYFSTAYTGQLMQTKDGFVTNALHGFINMMTKVQKDFDYTHVLVAFDTSKKTFRHDMLESYKDGRAAMPEDFKPQIPLIKKYLDLMGIHRLEVEGFEADDIIGSMAQIGCDSAFAEIHIISGDKDLLQLVNDCITVHFTKKGVTEMDAYTPEKFLATYETTPDKLPDLKGMMGDSSDNLPGIPGIGEKTAIKLIKQFGSLEALLENTDQLKGKQKENIENNKEIARLCREMATIRKDMTKLPAIEDLIKKKPDAEALRELYIQMEFNSFLKTLAIQTVDTKKTTTKTQIITDPAILQEKTYSDCALHVEIFEANYHQSTIIGFGICTDDETFYIPFDIAIQSEAFKKFLASSTIKKEMFDLKRIIVALGWEGLKLAGVAGDLLLKAYVLNPTTADTEFAKVALHYGVDDILYDEQIYGKGSKRAIPEIATIALQTTHIAATIHQLTQQLSTQLKDFDQWALYKEIELPLTHILAQMELEGITIDTKILQEMGEQLKERIHKLETDIHQLAGSTFNIGSPKQLGVVLFEDLGLPGKKTKTGSYSTSADILEKLKPHHIIIEKILEYRMLTKLYSTYIEGLQKACFEDGRVHTIFNQAHTQTGRLSSTEPNVQNIPIRVEEGRLIRKAFVSSSPEHVLIGADYSQIELRILAHMSQTESLILAFQNDEDVHKKTAAEVFGVSLADVTEAQRRGAKAINFGIVYGQSAFGLSEALNIPLIEAKHYIEGYLETYSGIKNYMDTTAEKAKETGYVETLFLRRRYVPEISHNNFMVRQAAERTAINAPIQGTAADIIKVAMIEVDKMMKSHNVKSKMVLQVHDELLFDVPKDEVTLMMEIVQKGMESATELTVPLKVEVSQGENWHKLK